MELKKEEIRVLRTKSRATSQVTFDVDYNVPDVKPDIGRMIQHKGEVFMEDVRLSEESGYLKGKLKVDLLYVGEEDGRVYSLTAQLPMEETLNLEGISGGDKMCLKWDVEDLSIHLIHSRKLNIRSLVTFSASVDELEGILLPGGVDDGTVAVKKKQMRLLSLAVHKKDTLRLKEEVQLAANKPNIAELLWYTAEVRGLDLRPEEGRIRAKGEIFIFFLYMGDDENRTVQWTEYTAPFERDVECGGCAPDMIPNIETTVIDQSAEIKPDADGEERLVAVDMVLELNMKLYREEEHSVILDVYTPERQCIPKGKQEILESLLVRNFSKCRLSKRAEIRDVEGRVLQICHSQGRVKVDKTTVTENGIRVEGVAGIRILYVVGNDDMPFYSTEIMIPFSHVVEARGIQKDSIYYLRADLEQLSVTMPDGGEIEVRATIGLNALVLSSREELIIDRIEEEPLDMEKVRSMPGITVYMVKEGDTLWDIAKRFCTTVDEIRSLNSLEKEEPDAGRPLLLTKRVKY